MSWVCPICSNTNEDDLSECYVCGHIKIVTTVDDKGSEKTSASCTVVYSVFEYIDKYFKDKSEKKKVKAKEKPSSKEKVIPKKKIGKSDKFVPWEEHAITIDYDVLKGKGYKQIEKSELGGVKGYKLIKDDESSQFVRKEILILQKIAKNK